MSHTILALIDKDRTTTTLKEFLGNPLAGDTTTLLL
jgi:hypothetical protein